MSSGRNLTLGPRQNRLKSRVRQANRRVSSVRFYPLAELEVLRAVPVHRHPQVLVLAAQVDGVHVEVAVGRGRAAIGVRACCPRRTA